MNENSSIRVSSALLAIGITLAIWFVIPVPEGVTPQAWHLLALFIGTIAAIIGKAMPIGALAMIAIALVALTGVTNNKPGAAIADALSGFSNPLIWLIGISIMISRGLIKTGLGARIGYTFIRLFGKKTLGIGYALGLSELVLAPVTPSNTARGGGIMHPIMRSIAESFESTPDKGSSSKIGRYLALVNYHSNPITSAMFITATAPNPLVVKFVAEATGAQISLSWSTWALAMLLPGLVAMALMPLVLYWLSPPEIKDTPAASQFARDRIAELGSIKGNEKILLGVFALMLLLWAGVPAMLLGKAYEVDATAAAALGLSLLLVTSVLEWDDVLKEKGAWDTITWFAALVMMATFLNKLGLITWFSKSIETGILGLGLGWVGAVALLTLVYMYAHYLFASTTAHITAMFGAFFAAGIALGAPPMAFALLLAAVSSIMMTLTHYATGTSPIIFGSGYVSLGEWWKVGFVMSLVNLAVWVLVGGLWWSALGYW
ncbi:MAG: anion permease [Gammaproteobacteria bacterium]|uniref:DASS family sodium-coupled anion symporter n=1 Tax=Rhodoferax sp. TaxID=50421 RepID=UPI0017C9CE97|nr:DASS family sodium-coupled anion symporter [Rhodoferax sp.]MBU3899437.1 anion permease [Gammaproteobacteria bacterium]MBA3057262.1 DASS family sodium-coupled anion symporter [Rhodoferax sp.]MBU3996341.1 anion permease [Gammaproteobacteria bacterium]MBU4080692.1 anion permease [Gammaproteobacteria bacterium]MBU4113518.1 anion permease [Gammaproteobacteria bacterium]